MVSVAQRMADGGVLAIRGPAIVDQDAAQVLDNAHCVHGGGAPLLVEVVEREFGGRCRVYSEASTRRPVSSAWTTSAPASWSRSEARKASSLVAPSWTMATIVPVDTGIP